MSTSGQSRTNCRRFTVGTSGHEKSQLFLFVSRDRGQRRLNKPDSNLKMEKT